MSALYIISAIGQTEKPMDKDTNDKLNDTLGKMGVMGSTQPTASNGNKTVKSSDKNFYIILIAMVVAMALYISYDMEQRYGSGKMDAVTTSPDQKNGQEPIVQESNAPKTSAQEPIVISVEKKKTIAVNPLTEIPATEQAPEAMVVEKIVEQQTVSTAIVPTAEPPVDTIKQSTEDTKAKPDSAAIPVVTGVVNEMEKQYKDAVNTAAKKASKSVSAPVAEQTGNEVTVFEKSATASATTSADMPAPAYNAYGYPYGRPYQRNYYQPQGAYRNPYYNQNRNPYRSEPGYGYGSQSGYGYGNQSGYGYGSRYGYNPYQQPVPATK